MTKPFRRKTDFIYSRQHFVNWFILAFLSGSVNAGGFLACQRFVSHVTGFATLFGVDFARGDTRLAFGMLSVPLFFLMGSMVSAFLVERRIHQDLVPRYAIAMFLVFLCLFSASLLGASGSFGQFGAALEIDQGYLLLALLCTASGLQNAVITSVSGAVVRTTHLTGITTDLGIGLVRVLFPAKYQHSVAREVRFNMLRAGTIGAFILGSTAGAIVCQAFGYLGFLLPSAIAVYAIVAAKVSWERMGLPRQKDHVESRDP